MVAEAPIGGRAEKTRQSILAAAKHLFAERGFAATRLEDIAEQVGIRRASMVCHFKDKRELHSAVIASVLGDLSQEIREAAEAGDGPQARIENAIGAWVDYVGKRPATARILLRELANAGTELPKELMDAARPLASFVRRSFIQDAQVRQFFHGKSKRPIDPLQIASTVAGATLFFVAATPLLSQREGFDPLDADQLSAHKAEVMRVVRRLLHFDDR
jgi:TetR/AcrR family transcriptional regulator